jgi:hypothetical protein
MFYLSFAEKFRSVLTDIVGDYDDLLGTSLSEDKFINVLEKLGMIVFFDTENESLKISTGDKGQDKDKDKDNKDFNNELKLSKEIFNELKIENSNESNTNNNNEENNIHHNSQESTQINSISLISSNDLLTFLTAIIGVYKIHLLKQKGKIETKNILKSKQFNDELSIIQKDLEEKSNQENITKKNYVSRTPDRELFITFENYAKIKSKFGLLHLNMSVQKSLKSAAVNIQQEELKYTFKPELNKYSREIYSEYLMKLNEFDPEQHSGEVENKTKQDERLAYIERLLMKKKKKDTENQKQKIQMMEKEMENCSFKPKLDLTSNYYKNLNKDETPSSNKGKRYEQLFQIGTQKRQERRDADKIEMDYAKYGKECTFEPKLEK